MASDPDQRLRDLELRVRQLENRLGLSPEPGRAPARPAAHAAPTAPGEVPPPPPPARPRDPMLAVRLLARAGILVLALGVVFFLKLAYDRGWVPIPGRFAIGLAGGALLFAGGELMRRRRMDSAVSQVFAGGGAVVAYITLYVGYALPEYRSALHMALGADIALLAVVSVLLAAYAFWMRLPVLAGVAAALGHILVAPAGEFTTLGLLFVAFLDIGFMLAAAQRGWSSLIGTVLLGATLVHGVAAILDTIAWQLPATTILAIDGLALLALHRAKGPSVLHPVLAGAAIASLFVVEALALHRGGLHDAEAWTALALGLAAVGLALATRPLAPGLGAAAAILLLAWPPLHFDENAQRALAYTAMALAAVSASMALRAGRFWVQVAAIPASAFGMLCVLAAMDPRIPGAQIGFATAAMALALLAGAALFHVHRGDADRGRVLRILGLGVAVGAAMLVVRVLAHGLPITIAWGAEALLVVVLGLVLRDGDLRVASFAMFGLVLVRVFGFDLNNLSLPARVLAFLATGALLLAGSFLYARQRRASADPGPGPSRDKT